MSDAADAVPVPSPDDTASLSTASSTSGGDSATPAPPAAPTTRGPLTVEYCPNCSMPPEYCEFSSCYVDKCRAWLEKHHPELLTDEVAGQVGGLSVQDKKEEKAADAKKEEKKPTAAAGKKKKQPAAKDEDDEDDEDGEDDDDDDDDEENGDKGKRGASSSSAAAAIRSKAPAAVGVFIRKEARSKHKYITSVKGLDGFGCDLKKAAKSFSKKFACSASVVKLADGGLEIQIQGDVLTELPDFIIAEFRGVDKSALFFMDKANKKTRCF